MRTADPSEWLCGLRTSIAFVADAPDLVTAVVGNQHAAVSHLEKRHGPPPNLTLIRRKHPTRQEMARLIRRALAILERKKGNLLAHALRPVPPAVPREKRAAVILGRQLLARADQTIQ